MKQVIDTEYHWAFTAHILNEPFIGTFTVTFSVNLADGNLNWKSVFTGRGWGQTDGKRIWNIWHLHFWQKVFCWKGSLFWLQLIWLVFSFPQPAFAVKICFRSQINLHRDCISWKKPTALVLAIPASAVWTASHILVAVLMQEFSAPKPKTVHVL